MKLGENIFGIRLTVSGAVLPLGKSSFDISHIRIVLLKAPQQLVQFVVEVDLMLYVDELVHLDESFDAML